ncbi:unnamed protein product [Rotaria socialis]|uniref:GED domain-containing protein n=1 Tax=Rotaria socialis TaxID=392032 RepID=A0A817WNR1_9BILA|nr:unnamed protein product [Rotaria socialis]CAF4341557.1 unnamed protein product [Rotaria socialis]
MTFRVLSEHDEKACSDNILLLKLLPFFRDLLQSYLNYKRQIVYDQLQELIRLEKQDPYTINHCYTTTIKNFEMQRTEEKLPKSSSKNDSSGEATDEDDELMFKSSSNDDEAVQDMLTSIRVYWKLLLQRFIDYAALSIRAGCVFDICPDIRKRFRQVPTEQVDFVDAYLMEDAFVRTKRQQLQQARERLKKVDAILGGSSSTIYGNDASEDSIEIRNPSFMTLDQLEERVLLENIDEASPPPNTNSTNRLFQFGQLVTSAPTTFNLTSDRPINNFDFSMGRPTFKHREAKVNMKRK